MWLLPLAVRHLTKLQGLPVGRNEEELALQATQPFQESAPTDVNCHTGALMRKCMHRRGCYIKRDTMSALLHNSLLNHNNRQKLKTG